MRLFIIAALIIMAGPCLAQTATPDIYIYATLESGQMTRFDFTATAGSIHNANLLTLVLFSLWGMFFFAVFAMWKGKRA